MERVPNPAAAINWYKAGIKENASIYKIKDNIVYESNNSVKMAIQMGLKNLTIKAKIYFNNL